VDVLKEDTLASKAQPPDDLSNALPCPNCGELVDPREEYCPGCGAPLALAAALAASAISFVPAEDTPITPEILVPRLGERLVDSGLLEPDDLQRALNFQKEQAAKGEKILLGQALVKLKMIDSQQLDQAVTTQILQLQEALKQANQQLEERVQKRTFELETALSQLTELDRLKANFISNISHELRTPLAHIIGYIDLLRSEGLGPLTHDQTEALAVIGKAYTRLQNLIDDLIQFSLLAEEGTTLSTAPVALKEVVEAVVAKSQGKASEKDISIHVNIPDSPPIVLADEQRIAWVLEQLLDNGIKFNRQGGEVHIHTQTNELQATIAVIDTGIGIPEDKLEEIFRPFHQLDGSSTRRYGGTGLGLTLVQRIIKAHNSKLLVESRVGKGSQFSFTLPIAENET
jgi:signal transduction histidine kinase